MKRSINIWNQLDKVTVLIFLLMLIMGWFNIYAAVYNEEHKEIFDLSQRYGKQFLWIIATLILAVFILIIDSRFYLFFSWVIYGIIILLLIFVLVFGTEVNGARSWFEFGPVSLQPSEFAKFVTALALAGYLSRKNIDLTRLKDFLPAFGIILLPAFLTALQPDMGSTIVFFAFVLVLFREGMSPFIFVSGLLEVLLFFLTLLIDNLYLQLAMILVAFILAYFATRRWKLCFTGFSIIALTGGLIFMLDRFLLKSLGNDLVILIAVILSGLVFAYYIYLKKAMEILIIYLFLLGGIIYINSVDYTFDNILKPHQKERVEIMLGFKSDPHGTGYNVNQSIISIGSGGFSGKGYLQGHRPIQICTFTEYRFIYSAPLVRNGVSWEHQQ